MITINFSCPTCSQKTVLQEKYLQRKKDLTCQNCSSVFPDSEFQELKRAVLEIANVEHKLYSDVSPELGESHWQFKIEM